MVLFERFEQSLCQSTVLTQGKLGLRDGSTDYREEEETGQEQKKDPSPASCCCPACYSCPVFFVCGICGYFTIQAAEPASARSPTASGLLRGPSQRRIESIRITTAANMIIVVRMVLIYPCTAVSGFCAIGQKMSVIDSQPATSVVLPTKLRGRIVTQLYLAFPELMIIVVATHRATAASKDRKSVV